MNSFMKEYTCSKYKNNWMTWKIYLIKKTNPDDDYSREYTVVFYKYYHTFGKYTII